MEKNVILAKVQEIFQDVLDNEDVELTLDTTAEDIVEWDSLAHVQIISELQKEFSIKFNSSEISSWKKIDDIINSIIENGL